MVPVSHFVWLGSVMVLSECLFRCILLFRCSRKSPEICWILSRVLIYLFSVNCILQILNLSPFIQSIPSNGFFRLLGFLFFVRYSRIPCLPEFISSLFTSWCLLVIFCIPVLFRDFFVRRHYYYRLPLWILYPVCFFTIAEKCLFWSSIFVTSFVWCILSSDWLDESSRSSVSFSVSLFTVRLLVYFRLVNLPSVFFSTIVTICIYCRTFMYWCPVRCPEESAWSVFLSNCFWSRTELFHSLYRFFFYRLFFFCQI